MTATDAGGQLAGLGERAGVILGARVDQVRSAEDLAASTAPAVMVLTAGDAAVVPALDAIIRARTAPTALVIGDGYLGTDGPDVPSALVGASVVALARSIAVQRAASGRVNVVAVPESLLGAAGTQRGPIRDEIGVAEIADVVGFLLGPHSSYIDGQVLFADGGRHLFSSLTA